MVDLGTLGGLGSRAVAVNDSGQVVGTSQAADGSNHGFSWTTGGGMIDLGALGPNGRPAAVNESGEVVGTRYGDDGSQHAFLWTASGGMVDLGTLGGDQSSAAAIDDRRPDRRLERDSRGLAPCGPVEPGDVVRLDERIRAGGRAARRRQRHVRARRRVHRRELEQRHRSGQGAGDPRARRRFPDRAAGLVRRAGAHVCVRGQARRRQAGDDGPAEGSRQLPARRRRERLRPPRRPPALEPSR